MKACEIKHLGVRYAQINALCAILISSPLAYTFYTFFKYRATYSSLLKTCSSFIVETGPALAGNLLLGIGTYYIQDICLFPTGWKVYGRMSQKNAGRARVVLQILFQ